MNSATTLGLGFKMAQKGGGVGEERPLLGLGFSVRYGRATTLVLGLVSVRV